MKLYVIMEANIMRSIDMQTKIKIHNLGAIKDCELTLDDFTVLTGAQASGKSTIAKCIYFFRTIKEDFLSEIMRYKIPITHQEERKIIKRINSTIRSKFLQLFGSSMAMPEDMYIEYCYTDDTWVKVRLELKEGATFINPKFVIINYSSNILNYISSVDKNSVVTKEELRSELKKLFHDEYDIIYIPAGRSLITLLTAQLNYIFATMDDEQKRSLDYCTQKYIEYILKIRTAFEAGIKGLIARTDSECFKSIKLAQKCTDDVLHGEYVYTENEERFYFTDNCGGRRYVRLNYTSSGQQESVWIFNILIYLLANKTKAFVIVEEPEAHLYPDAQKIISEMLALVSNNGCQLLVTTHSPYILGATNNLIYANYLSTQYDVNDVVNKFFHIKNHNAYYVQDGKITSCLEDSEEKLICNEIIDGASETINNTYDTLFDFTVK